MTSIGPYNYNYDYDPELSSEELLRKIREDIKSAIVNIMNVKNPNESAFTIINLVKEKDENGNIIIKKAAPILIQVPAIDFMNEDQIANLINAWSENRVAYRDREITGGKVANIADDVLTEIPEISSKAPSPPKQNTLHVGSAVKSIFDFAGSVEEFELTKEEKDIFSELEKNIPKINQAKERESEMKESEKASKNEAPAARENEKTSAKDDAKEGKAPSMFLSDTGMSERAEEDIRKDEAKKQKDLAEELDEKAASIRREAEKFDAEKMDIRNDEIKKNEDDADKKNDDKGLRISGL